MILKKTDGKNIKYAIGILLVFFVLLVSFIQLVTGKYILNKINNKLKRQTVTIVCDYAIFNNRVVSDKEVFINEEVYKILSTKNELSQNTSFLKHNFIFVVFSAKDIDGYEFNGQLKIAEDFSSLSFTLYSKYAMINKIIYCDKQVIKNMLDKIFQ